MIPQILYMYKMLIKIQWSSVNLIHKMCQCWKTFENNQIFWVQWVKNNYLLQVVIWNIPNETDHILKACNIYSETRTHFTIFSKILSAIQISRKKRSPNSLPDEQVSCLVCHDIWIIAIAKLKEICRNLKYPNYFYNF